jgi:hypothetical protein
MNLRSHILSRHLTLFLLAYSLVALSAQGIQPSSPTTTNASRAPLPSTTASGSRRQTNLTFTTEKPVLGFSMKGNDRPTAHCSTEGTAYFDPTANASHAGTDIYGVSPDGNVKHLLRKLPIDFTNISVRDLFVGDQQIVTLLKAEKRDDGTDSAPPPETGYFAALEDTSGDLNDLVDLQLHFKPLRMARFGSGDLIVLGWDEGNLLPILVMLSVDGTPHRFIDFEPRQPVHTGDTPALPDPPSINSLQGASFVPFNSDILLTYPNTTKPIRRLTAIGSSFAIPIYIPGGYVLDDVLPSSGYSLVVRVKEALPSGKQDAKDFHPRMRVLEDNAFSGSLMREFIFDKPSPTDLTCAARSSISAIFMDAIPDANHIQSSDPTAAPPMQLVVATTRR